MDESVVSGKSGPVAIAMREARALHHAHVGTEHLLLGLLLDEQGEARRILNELGLTAERVRGELRRVPSVVEPPRRGRLPFTPRVRRALEACAEVVRRTRAPTLRSEHLLLGILEQNDGLARRALVEFDVDVDVVRQRTLAVLANAEARTRRPIPQKVEVSALEAFGEDWSRLGDKSAAPDAALDRAVIAILTRERRRAAILIGCEGAGKTTALRRVAGAIRESTLRPGRLIAVHPGGVVAGARHRGRVEDRVRALFAEALATDAALAFDDLHLASAWPEFVTALELAMRARNTPVLASISTRGLETLLHENAPLLSLFEPLRVTAPAPADRIAALAARIKPLEAHHSMRIPIATQLAALSKATDQDLAEALSRIDRAAAERRAIMMRPNHAICASIADAARFEREAERAAAEGDDALRADCLARARSARESARRAISAQASATAGAELEPADLDPINTSRD